MAPQATKAGSDRVQVLDEVLNSDLKAKRNEYIAETPVLSSLLAPLVKDKRDMPMLHLMLNIFEVVVPGALLVFAVNLREPQLPLAVRHVIGLAYYVSILLLFQERFTLMLHFSSHRAIFQNPWLNGLAGWVMAPFFGIPCNLYRPHHVIMHHIENNHELDTSSTEMYQRDSWFDFAKYWFRFVIKIQYELVYYCRISKRYDLSHEVFGGQVLYMCAVFMLCRYVSPVATMWVFIIPHVFAMSVMSFGNWAQHIFVNPQDYKSNFGLTYNCIDTPVNQTTFNDGYHIVHHLNARLHWSEMPDYFVQTKDKHLEAGALTFRGLHFFDVGFLVMTKQLRKLVANHYVHLGPKDTAPTVEAVESRLRTFLQPVQVEEAKKAK